MQPVLLLSCIIHEVWTADDDTYNIINDDGSYNFGYNNPDSYHHSQANRNNVVRGEFGGRNPGTGNYYQIVLISFNKYFYITIQKVSITG